jgi:hypothetical protein
LQALCHYPESSFKLLKGNPKKYAKTADGGNTITNLFWYVFGDEVHSQFINYGSGDCGSVMWREGGTFAGSKIIKV